MKLINTETYSVFHVSKWIIEGRERLYKSLLRHVNMNDVYTVLDVGATSDQKNEDSNFFLKKFAEEKKVTALSNEDARWLENAYPGLEFVLGDGRRMPFEDNSFDLVFSNAVIEHVGSLQQQERFLLESVRVARKHIFLTTPNRWYPVELHTLLPFVHYLPKQLHRRILRLFGHEFLSREENLKLMDIASIKRLLHKNGIHNYQIDTISFFGLPSNIYVYINKI